MCGRSKRRSDKQKVARVFGVQAGLEDTDFAPGDDLRPQSMQPVVYGDLVFWLLLSCRHLLPFKDCIAWCDGASGENASFQKFAWAIPSERALKRSRSGSLNPQRIIST
jgi:hypothetical protein